MGENSHENQSESQKNRSIERSMQEEPRRAINFYFDTTGMSSDQNNKSYLHRVLETVVLPEIKEYASKIIDVFDSKTAPNLYTNICGSSDPIQIPGSDYTDNASEYDTIIFFKTTDIDGVLGYAGSCARHPSSNRPNVGIIALSSVYYKEITKDDVDEFRSTVWHEILHILGINSSDFDLFKPNWPVTETNKNNTETTNIYVNNVQKEFLLLRTPTVTSTARIHFAYENAPGLLLENEGGPGSKNSHLEKIHYNNEGMTAAGTGDAVFSVFTLAILEDSGWYKVDLKGGETLYYGRGAGEAFYNNFNCDELEEEFCHANQSTGCSADFQHLTSCSATYFSDECRINEVRQNGNCTDESGHQGKDFDYVGDDARCFDIKKDNFSTGRTESRCYQSDCIENNSQIKITIDGESQVCTSEDQILTFKSSDSSKKFDIVCPDIADFCSVNAVCEDNCNNNGNCTDDNKCRCFYFWGGERCDEPIKTCPEEITDEECKKLNPNYEESTGSGDTGSGDTGSGDTGSGDTGSGDTGSGDTGSGDTGNLGHNINDMPHSVYMECYDCEWYHNTGYNNCMEKEWFKQICKPFVFNGEGINPIPTLPPYGTIIEMPSRIKKECRDCRSDISFKCRESEFYERICDKLVFNSDQTDYEPYVEIPFEYDILCWDCYFSADQSCVKFDWWQNICIARGIIITNSLSKRANAQSHRSNKANTNFTVDQNNFPKQENNEPHIVVESAST